MEQRVTLGGEVPILTLGAWEDSSVGFYKILYLFLSKGQFGNIQHLKAPYIDLRRTASATNEAAEQLELHSPPRRIQLCIS